MPEDNKIFKILLEEYLCIVRTQFYQILLTFRQGIRLNRILFFSFQQTFPSFLAWGLAVIPAVTGMVGSWIRISFSNWGGQIEKFPWQNSNMNPDSPHPLEWVLSTPRQSYFSVVAPFISQEWAYSDNHSPIQDKNILKDMTSPYIVLLTVIYFLSTLLSFSYYSCYGWFGAFSLSSLLNLTLYRPTKYLQYFSKTVFLFPMPIIIILHFI